MKVYCTPLKIKCTSGRLSASSFFNQLALSYGKEIDSETTDKKVVFRFFEDGDVYLCVVLTMKKSKSYCEANEDKNDFTLSVKGAGGSTLSEANILIMKKNNMAGVYIHNEGSMPLNTFEAKIRAHYYSTLRGRFNSKKRDEKFMFSRVVDNSILLDKISKFSFVEEINATFTGNVASKRFLNGSLYNKSKSVRVTMRTGLIPISTKVEKDDLVGYLSELSKKSGSVSLKGRTTANSAGETIGLIDAVNSIASFDHDEYLKDLNGIKLNDFLKSKIFSEKKALILSNKLLK
ncbi:hypothetical protein [Serratia sp. CY37869]|uniref:hypothetical protein n=1 Tax=Serratia sp. CY37869 TaxID=3383612 RepID=UPI003F9EDD35